MKGASRKLMGRRNVVAIAVEPCRTFPRPMSRAISGAIEWGNQQGWEFVDLEPWHMQAPESLQPDGLITHVAYGNTALAKRLRQAVPCCVHIDSLTPGVQVDYVQVGLNAADYLLDRGFRNFAISAFRRRSWPEILITFEKRVCEAGATCARIPSYSVRSDLAMERNSEFFKRRLAKLNLPLAIFCTNDRLAVRLCRWCLEAGVEVPEQVAILGANNDVLACECSPVPISSVDLQCEHRGIEAAKLLQRMMDGEAAPDEPLLVPPGQVVTRRSTDILAIQDLVSARALRYVWDHYTEDISVNDIARLCGVSRRSLDRHFGMALGHTVNQELCHRRLVKACELLATTELPAVAIAAQTGFRSAQYFSLRFKRAFGISPRRYRIREQVKKSG